MELRLDLPFPLEPAYAAQHAELLVAAAAEVAELELDYAPASLEDLDAVIEGFREEGVPIQDLGELLVGFGCYVGELIRRQLGGFWIAEDALNVADRRAAGWMVLAFNDDVWCNPLGTVFNRFQDGAEVSLPEFFAGLLAKRRANHDTAE